MTKRVPHLAALAALILVASSPPTAARAEAATPSAFADDPTLIALAVSLACSDAPDTVATSAPLPAQPANAAQPQPELELVATVHAKSLVFDKVPQVHVTFHGTGPRHPVWKTERVNLPMHPEPGKVYKDVQVRLTVSSTFEELSRLLDQAKRASRGIRIENDVPSAAAAPATAGSPPAAAASPGHAASAPPASRDAPTPAAPPAASPSR